MENLETLVTIITTQNKTIEGLENRLKTSNESSTFWYKKYKEMEEKIEEIKKLAEDNPNDFVLGNEFRKTLN